jgi:GT2 family glycosyltransferase
MAEVSEQVTIVIVNWNSGDYLERCLDSVNKMSLLPRDVIIYDNNSSDGSEDLKSVFEYLNITIVKGEHNIGFAAANNYMIRDLIETEYVVTLNADAFPDTEWLRNLVDFANSHRKYASLSSVQVAYDNEILLDGVGDKYHFTGMVGRKGYRKKFKPIKGNSDVFSACAGAALYRRKIFLEVGGFDEDFFCFIEDVDLGFRLVLAGYDCCCVCDAVVLHVGGASSGGHHSDTSLYYGHRNIEWAYIKNMPPLLLILSLPFHFILIILEFAVFFRIKKANVIIKSKVDAIRQLKKVFIKRREIQRKRRISYLKLVRKLSFFSIH